MDEIERTLRRSDDLARLPSPAERRQIRARTGVSQSAIARMVGVSSACVNRWEMGSRLPRGPLLRRYLNVLARLGGAQ